MIIKNNKFLKKRKDPETIVPKDEERFFFVALLIERANYDSWVILGNPRQKFVWSVNYNNYRYNRMAKNRFM